MMGEDLEYWGEEGKKKPVPLPSCPP